MKIDSGRDTKIGGDVSEGKVKKRVDLTKFWENFDTIAWGVSVLVLVGAIVYLSVTGKEVPQILAGALGVAVGKVIPKTSAMTQLPQREP